MHNNNLSQLKLINTASGQMTLSFLWDTIMANGKVAKKQSHVSENTYLSFLFLQSTLFTATDNDLLKND